MTISKELLDELLKGCEWPEDQLYAPVQFKIMLI